MDFRQSKPFGNYLIFSGWRRVEHRGLVAYEYTFAFGNFWRISRPRQIDFTRLNQSIRKYHPSIIKIEPDTAPTSALEKILARNKFYKDTWSIEPTKTLTIDLRQSTNQIYSNFKPKWRQNIRFAIKRNVTIKASNDIKTFTHLWQLNAKRKKHFIESDKQTIKLWEEFSKIKGAQILIAYYKKHPVAASFLIFSNKTCYLWHLANSGQSSEVKPLYLLVAKSIEFAKRKKLSSFDFEGIVDERYPYSKSTQDLQFKKGFGGEEKSFIGSFIRFENPLLGFGYRIISSINPGIFRRVLKSVPS